MAKILFSNDSECLFCFAYFFFSEMPRPVDRQERKNGCDWSSVLAAIIQSGFRRAYSMFQGYSFFGLMCLLYSHF